MYRVILAALFGLCACTGPVRDGGAAFRDPGAPIYSAAAFDPARLTGHWTQPVSFGSGTSSGCRAGAVEFKAAGSGTTVAGELCLDGRMQSVSGRIGFAGSGRFAVPGMDDWWVLWADSGYRTLVIGTPSGAFGFILDRGAIPADRLGAAREIFEFNGYLSEALGPV